MKPPAFTECGWGRCTPLDKQGRGVGKDAAGEEGRLCLGGGTGWAGWVQDKLELEQMFAPHLGLQPLLTVAFTAWAVMNC